MSQQDYTIDNATGAAVRADLNATLQAIVSANSGTSEPSTMFAYQIWADTTANKLKIRNGANNAWYDVGALDTANLGLMLASFFPNVNGNVTASDEELNILDGFTGVTADLTYAKDLRATGVTSSEFDTLDGVTSSIQTQINTKALTAGSSSQTFSVDTPTNSNHAVTKTYVDSITTTTKGGIFTGSGTFLVPADVTAVFVQVIGAGSGYAYSSYAGRALSAGGSGAFFEGVINVSANSTLAVTVGAKGANVEITGYTSADSDAGGASSIVGTGVNVVCGGGTSARVDWGSGTDWGGSGGSISSTTGLAFGSQNSGKSGGAFWNNGDPVVGSGILLPQTPDNTYGLLNAYGGAGGSNSGSNSSYGSRVSAQDGFVSITAISYTT